MEEFDNHAIIQIAIKQAPRILHFAKLTLKTENVDKCK